METEYHLTTNATDGRTPEEQETVEKNLNPSAIIANIVESKEVIIPKNPPDKSFPQPYVEKVFRIWYERGKPSAKKLMQFIPANLDEWGRTPHWTTVEGWLEHIFVPRANELDAEVKRQLDALVVKEKVEMLKRHADVGVQMQNMSIEYLNEHRDEISAPAAVRMLVEGIRIERESRGIPAALDKIRDMNDEELKDEIMQIITGAGVKLEDIDAPSE